MGMEWDLGFGNGMGMGFGNGMGFGIGVELWQMGWDGMGWDGMGWDLILVASIDLIDMADQFDFSDYPANHPVRQSLGEEKIKANKKTLVYLRMNAMEK